MKYKFRAWHKISKTMLYETHDYPGKCFQWLAEAQPIEIMMWTGLTNRHGKEIYEADIVKYYRSPIYRDEISEVKYINSQHIESESGFWPFINFNGGRVVTDSIEIIGNIYENPELLENKK